LIPLGYRRSPTLLLRATPDMFPQINL